MGSIEAHPLVVELDTSVYRLSAIKKAAYRFGDRCHILLESADGDGRVKVTLTAKRLLDDPQYLLGEFKNEVLDQELREVVAQETEAVRNLILAQAFSATSLLDPVGESADFRADPLGIRRPDNKPSQDR